MPQQQPQSTVFLKPTVMLLEDRVTPAGDVTAFVGGGVLNIIGDDAANAIRVDRTGVQSVFIRSIDGTTRINGSTEPVEFVDIANGFDIKLNGGNDSLVVSNVNRRFLNVEMGSGDDSVEIISSRINRESSILLGVGNDTLRVFNSTLKRRTAIDGGEGNDAVTLEKSSLEKNAYISGGPGTNQIFFRGTYIAGGSPVDGFTTLSTTLPPRAIDDAAIATQGLTVQLNVTANDQPGTNPLSLGTVTITTQPRNGSATNNGNGNVTYTNNGTVGADSFTYTVADNSGTVSNVATVNVSVTASTNTDAPVAAITTTGPSPSSNATIPIQVQFNKAVIGFTAASVTLTNGTISSFNAVDSRTFTFSVAPQNDGRVLVDIAAGAVQDSTGNGNAAASFLATSIRTDAGMTNTAPSATDPNFQQRANGLGVWNITPGTGATVTSSSTIRVFYTGWLTNGNVFDQARSPGNPATFALENTIQGFQQGLVGMQVGGIRRLLIPPSLGYGNTQTGSIPPNSTLIFEVKLLAVT